MESDGARSHRVEEVSNGARSRHFEEVVQSLVNEELAVGRNGARSRRVEKLEHGPVNEVDLVSPRDCCGSDDDV